MAKTLILLSLLHAALAQTISLNGKPLPENYDKVILDTRNYEELTSKDLHPQPKGILKALLPSIALYVEQKSKVLCDKWDVTIAGCTTLGQRY